MKLKHISQMFSFLLLAFSVLGYSQSATLSDDYSAEAELKEVQNSIIKIYTSYNQHDHHNPWMNMGPQQKSGSGAVIQLPCTGQYAVLTNSHVVSAHTYIEGRRNGQTQRFQLAPLWISHELDLALLAPAHEYEKAAFFRDAIPIPLGELAPLQSDLMLLGFADGGDTISASKGILSRLEYQSYFNSGFSFLAGQIDASGDLGNSGGPAIVDGKIAGVLMQRKTSHRINNTAYIVPADVIKQFLDDIADGFHNGVPSLGIATEPLENEYIKMVYGIRGNNGVLVRHVVPGSSADGILMPDDVIVEIDEYPVGNDKTILLRGNERISMDYVVHSKQIRDSVNVKVIRKKQEHCFRIMLTHSVNHDLLVGVDGDASPSYYIYQGLVFTKVTRELLLDGSARSVSIAGLEPILLNNFRFPGQDEMVVILKVLPHEANRGYHHLNLQVVESIGSKKVKNLAHLIHLLESSNHEFLEINSGYKGLDKLILNTTLADSVTDEVMWLNGIQHDRSKNLRVDECSLYDD